MQPLPTMPLRAAIYDMDGLLVDSEPFWVEAEVEVFGGLGVPMTPELCRETTGMRLDEAMEHWFHRFPWVGPSRAEVLATLLARAQALIVAGAVLKPGVTESLAAFRARGMPCALASSSPRALIAAVMKRFQLGRDFQVAASAESEPYGKPHPAVYLSAAKALGVPAVECVALEDSLNGLIAAKAAKMACIAVPERWPDQDPRFILADAVVGSLTDVDDALLGLLGARTAV